jgi:hypothetical protein
MMRYEELTDDLWKAQGERCACKGNDDLCVCQNTPDSVTLKEWGLHSPIPSGYYNQLDLLEVLKRVVSVLDDEVFNELAADNLLRDARALVERFDK